MKKLKLNTITAIFGYTILATMLTSCSWDRSKQGLIVKDNKGNYYEIDGDDVLGDERYRLVRIDTTKYKPVGF